MVGLRGRLVALLAVVCAVTLGVCALALLPPLDKRLRDDALTSLVRIAEQGVPALASTAGTPPHPSPALTSATRAVLRRGGAEVAVVAPDGRVLATTDPDSRERFPDAVRALRLHRPVRSVAGDGDGVSEARVAVPTGGGFAVVLRKPLTDVQRAVAVVRRAFLLAAVVSLAVAFGLGLLLGRPVVQRVRRLRDTALSVAELGPVAEFRPDSARDEVGDLTRAFATMQTRLHEQEAARRRFVATASHELRTPLASLRVMLDVARGDLAADDVTHALAQVEQADAQAERLATLAGELLDLSRLDAGVPLRSELVELTELMRSVAAEFGVRASEVGRAIELAAAEPTWAVGDPGGAARVIRILVDNALRHADGPVRVAATQRDGIASISVEDEGPGVALDERARIFVRFERGAAAQPGPGFGLGLAIGRELAQRMGGELTIDPRTARGARFVFTLPSAPAP